MASPLKRRKKPRRANALKWTYKIMKLKVTIVTLQMTLLSNLFKRLKLMKCEKKELKEEILLLV